MKTFATPVPPFVHLKCISLSESECIKNFICPMILWRYLAGPETAEPVNVRFLNGSLVMWRYHVVEALRMEGGPKVCLFLYFILLFRKPLSSQITHSQLPPITTGRLRHLQDATNTFVI